jgi:hypothetical protein
VLTIRGQRFFEPISVFVNGADCPVVRPTSASVVKCLLPQGAGSDQSVLVASGSFFSVPTKLLSFAKPIITSIAATGCHRVDNRTLDGCPRIGSVIRVP